MYDHKTILLSSVIVLIAMVIMIFTYKYLLIRYSLILILAFFGIWKRKQIIVKKA